MFKELKKSIKENPQQAIATPDGNEIRNNSIREQPGHLAPIMEEEKEQLRSSRVEEMNSLTGGTGFTPGGDGG